MVFCNSKALDYVLEGESHNPYFNRWFSAINGSYTSAYVLVKSQSLF